LENTWQFLKKINIALQIELAVILLAMCPRELKINVNTRIV
jgi:hypothetical protein